MNNLLNFAIHQIPSQSLKRVVRTDIYKAGLPMNANDIDLLIVNDGQDLLKMDMPQWIHALWQSDARLIVVGVHAGAERKHEYGVTGRPDFMNRGSMADRYSFFILQELLPYIKSYIGNVQIRNRYIAGFSLGGLVAFDLALEFPSEFNAAGIFSGSFWWRSIDLNQGYVEDRDRIMHAKIRTKKFNEHQRFFLQTGAQDETADRNKNGIIDSIDDTLDIIKEMERIGFDSTRQIKYLELPEGRHDVVTWSKVMPIFLSWLYAQ